MRSRVDDGGNAEGDGKGRRAGRNIKRQHGSIADGGAVDGQIPREGRNADAKFHAGNDCRRAVGDRIAEGVVRFAGNRHGGAAPLGRHRSGKRNGANDAVFRAEKGGKREFRPALPMVGGAAAEIRLQTENMGIPGVGRKRRFSGERGRVGLVDHLVILMRPKVLGGRSGQSVESDPFEPFRPFAVARIGVDLFERVHQFHHAAKFGAGDRTFARKTFVAVDRADGGPVGAGQNVVEVSRVIAVVAAEQVAGKHLAFEHHTKIDDVGVVAPEVERTLPKRLCFAVVESEVANKAGKRRDPRVVVARGKKIERGKGFKPAVPTPTTHGTPRRKVVVVVFHHPAEHFGNAVVARTFIIADEHFRDQLHRPCVGFFGFGGADPAVRLLTGKNLVHIATGAGDPIVVAEQVGKRNEAVEPIGDAFPTLAVASDPCAVANVGPNAVQIAGKSVCGKFELGAEPPRRLDFAGGEKGIFAFGFRLFHSQNLSVFGLANNIPHPASDCKFRKRLLYRKYIAKNDIFSRTR